MINNAVCVVGGCGDSSLRMGGDPLYDTIGARVGTSLDFGVSNATSSEPEPDGYIECGILVCVVVAGDDQMVRLSLRYTRGNGADAHFCNQLY